MDFTLSEEQQLVQDSFHKALDGLVGLDDIRNTVQEGRGCHTAATRSLTDMGLPGLLIEEEQGGSGTGLLEAALVSEQLGRFAAPIPFIASSVMGVLALQRGGSDAQKSNWLPKLANGRARLGVAFSDYMSDGRKAERITFSDGSLTGHANFSFEAAQADAFLIADDGGKVFLAESQGKGLSLEPFVSIDGTRSVCHLILDQVAAEPLPGLSESDLRYVINTGRLMLAADSLGASEKMLEMAVAYALERKQFDRVIGSFQAIKHLCAEMAAELQPCRSLIWYAAYAANYLPDEFDVSVLLAKSHMDEVGQFIAKTATEVYGGMGFADLTGVHYWYKRIGFNRSMMGMPHRLRKEAAALQGI
ncbi:MAG: acyl-CoA dehydrogenase family protein [Sneathiella sp.]